MGKQVTAKAKIISKAPGGGGLVNVAFGPDYQDGRNAEWSVATPSLSVSMNVKEDIAEGWDVGQPVTITFEQGEHPVS